MSVKPGDTVGGYELERKLGVGGMATVWLAHALGPKSQHKRVVLKLMHDHYAENKDVRELFEEEARLAQRLDHPNVVKVMATGRDQGRCFLAMEYVDGVDLRSAMQAHEGPLWPALACALVADACKGLGYAHGRKVVHRDMSPDNVMVDVEGKVRILDFGIARAEETELTTKTGLRKGKIRYMAPEYLRDHVANAQTDVYSMGASLHELVTGHEPFGKATPAVMFHAIEHKGLPRADSIRPSLPRTLVETISRATAREPRDRFGSASEFEAALRMFLKEYSPPLPKEVGHEVAVWKEKLAGGPLRPGRRDAGSMGQLETTEFVKVGVPTDPNVPGSGGSDWDVDTDPQKEQPLPSVVLDPELEKLAVRHHGPRKKKPAGKPRAKK